ncbi:hypothetical protein BGX27_006339 [Mortierella sp. AM989]|nr:hypothetical protein BGX27_006339 [Mortierella sp. AM989]
MPRTKPSSTNSTSAAATATLNDLSYPYPTPSTSPLLIPTLPLSALTSPLILKTPNQQYVHDSTLSLPIGTTLTIPRKNGNSRIGQSILGQLLAAHKPGRDHHKLAHDATLSLETIRPKEQQRRSILPSNWTMNFQKSTSIQGVSTASSQSTLQNSPGKMVPGSALGSNRSVMENLDQNDQPMLPSVWLESVLSQLSRSETNTLSHYATLPRVDMHQRRQPSIMFSDLERQSNEKANASKLKSVRSSSSLSSKAKGASTLNVSPQTLSRRGSACELALGEDARELFQQNRPKTLSSVMISTSIVPAKESLRNVRQRSLDSSVVMKPSVQPSNPLEPTLESSVSSSTTTKTTRGRFTIELAPPAPPPTRTRTLSCTSSITLQPQLTGKPPVLTEKPSTMPPEKPIYSKPPSPTRSFSLPPPSPNYITPRSANNVIMPPSPSLSPSRFTFNDSSSNGANSSTSNPILIPRASKPNHYRTQSNSSTQSAASASSRRSQVIIPPPASVASLQFASFASIAPPGGTASPHPQHQNPSLRHTAASNSSSNNFRNLSIQIVDGADKCDTGLDSHDSQVFHLDTPTIHPLDEVASARSEEYGTRSGTQAVHQTMNRVHPSQLSIDSLRDCNAPLTACSTSCSSVSSMGSSLGNYGSGNRLASQYGSDQNYQGYDRSSAAAGYFRQRSLSATNLDSHHGPQRPPSHSCYQTQQQQHYPQQQQQQGMWSERSTRRTHGSVSCSDHHSNGIPIKGMSESKSGPSMSSSYGGEVSDIVIKKSATGRMFTVERTIPASPTKCSRFTYVPTPTPPPRTPSPFQK